MTMDRKLSLYYSKVIPGWIYAWLGSEDTLTANLLKQASCAWSYKNLRENILYGWTKEHNFKVIKSWVDTYRTSLEIGRRCMKLQNPPRVHSLRRELGKEIDLQTLCNTQNYTTTRKHYNRALWLKHFYK